MVKLNIEDAEIKSYYWFYKSSKRKNMIVKYAEFCD